MKLSINKIKTLKPLKSMFENAYRITTIAGFIIIYPEKCNPKFDDKFVKYAITKDRYAEKIDAAVEKELPEVFKNVKDKTYVAEIYTEDGSGPNNYYVVFTCNNKDDSHYGKIVIIHMNGQDWKIKSVDYMKESVSNYIDTKLNIYEAYDAGIITESEKAELLLMVEEATVSKKKQKILDNQNELKENFDEISGDLKKMVISNAGNIKLEMTDKKFFRNHEDHKEQHYLLEYTLKPSDDIPKSKIAKVLLDIGNAVEKEFKKDKKDFLNKGLYFDNKKKDEMSRFVELHYDFY